MEFIEEQNQVTEAASQSVQPPAQDDIDTTALRIPTEFIECRAAVLRAADAIVHVFASGPAPRLDVAPEFLELVLWFLDRASRLWRRSRLARCGGSCREG